MKREDAYLEVDSVRGQQEDMWSSPGPPDPAPITIDEHITFMKGYIDDLMPMRGADYTNAEKLTVIRKAVATGIRAMELFG
jgi:hypothetical protein